MDKAADSGSNLHTFLIHKMTHFEYQVFSELKGYSLVVWYPVQSCLTMLQKVSRFIDTRLFIIIFRYQYIAQR